MRVAAASAPASIGNVAVGFDVLGQAFDAVRDRVVAHREERKGVRLGRVSGLVTSLPEEVSRNTALAGAAALLHAAGNPFGVRLDVEKRIPLSAGMGGSAASAVAAVAAVNALLKIPQPDAVLLRAALEGERASADPPPWDNVMAALYGGLVMAADIDIALVRPVPVPEGLVAVLLHPDARTETQAAREVLAPQVALPVAVDHARANAAFILGCMTGDRSLLRAGLRDRLIEPQRAFLLPALKPVQAAALEAGALGCSFSGSGPSVFAWAEARDADAVAIAMRKAFVAAGHQVTEYRAPLDSKGVQLEAVTEPTACA